MSVSLPATGLHIDGMFREPSGGGCFDIVDPATALPIASVADARRADALDAVEAASRALSGWSSTAPRRRSEILRRAYEDLVAGTDRFARLMVAENGKTLADARAEVGYAAEFLRWYAEEAVRLDGSVRHAPAGGGHVLVLRRPVGVAVLVTPWNFPLAMATRKIAPALAAGCTVVLKPSPETPLSALALAETLAAAGVPPGVVNVIPSDHAPEVVGAMLADPRVRKLSFTGSTQVGRALLARAAGSVLNCSMELGGNAPFLVFADADLEAAVDGAMVAKMRNGGQACTAANRFYVQRPVAREFTRMLADRMSRLRVGPGDVPASDVGPLISEAAQAKAAGLVASALGTGGRLWAGGAAPDGPGYFYRPTVLEVPPDASVLNEEVFGPIAPVVAFDTEQEAVTRANATHHGLAAYAYTADLATGMRVAEALETGMVGLNRGYLSDPSAPFGGVKHSGLGREGGHEGLLEYTESKYVSLSW